MSDNLVFNLSSSGEYELIEPDVYEAWIPQKGIEVKTGEYMSEPQTQLQITFALLSADGQETDQTIRCYSGFNKTTGQPSVHKNSRLGWIVRALGYDPDTRPLRNFDLKSLYEQPVRITIKAHTKQDGSESRKVTDIIASKLWPPQAEPAPAAPLPPPAPARPTAPVARPVRRSVTFDEGDA